MPVHTQMVPRTLLHVVNVFANHPLGVCEVMPCSPELEGLLVVQAAQLPFT